MNELNKKQREETGIHRQAEIQKGLKFEGKVRIYPGHKMWEYNPMDNSVRLALLNSEVVMKPAHTTNILGYEINQPARTVVENKLIRREGCVYVAALNKKNAIKALKRGGYSIKNLTP